MKKGPLNVGQKSNNRRDDGVFESDGQILKWAVGELYISNTAVNISPSNVTISNW